MSVDMLRQVRFDDYQLDLWDTGQTIMGGKSRLGYRLTHPDGHVIFEGEDFGCSPCQSIDSDDTLRSVLSFLTLRPGDTDADYFDDYTPDQMAWCESEAEELNLWAMELDDGGESEPKVFEEVGS